MPPLFRGELVGIAEHQSGGVIVLFGVFVCLCGIVVSGIGQALERARADRRSQKQAVIREFSFGKGVLVARSAASSARACRMDSPRGSRSPASAVRHGAHPLWQNLPVLIVILAGGFTTNVVWCLVLNARNRTAGDYLRPSLHRGRNYMFCAARPGPSGICNSCSMAWAPR